MELPGLARGALTVVADPCGMPTVIRKPLAVLAVAVAAVFGATALAKSGSSSSSSPAQASARPPGGALQPGNAVTGAIADKVKAAALAKYPGTIEGIVKLGNGSYLAHVIRADKTELHVLVSSTFQVTGVQQRPSQAPPGAPSGTTPGTSTGATT